MTIDELIRETLNAMLSDESIDKERKKDILISLLTEYLKSKVKKTE